MINARKKILAISGSTRKNSSNEAILRHIAESYGDLLEVEIYDGIDKLPHFNPDLDNNEPPADVVDFRNHIECADGVIICTPEYVFSLPGSLKNAREWSVSTMLFDDKPAAIIVASASGEKAFESLTLVLKTIGAKITDNMRLLIKGAKGKIGGDGEVTDQGTVYGIDVLVRSFIYAIDEKEGLVKKV